jgi:hypothetical protein
VASPLGRFGRVPREAMSVAERLADAPRPGAVPRLSAEQVCQGTLGLPESRLRDLSLGAGFGSVRRVPMDNPFNALFEIRP